MAASTYDASLSRLLAHEGGYTNHPSDPGGPTNFGITIADYRKYVKSNASASDVRAMSVDDARAIYRARYWDASRCDELPAGVDYAVFDYGVNSGIGRSGKVLRRSLGLPDSSSAVTDAVVAAARASDAKALVTAICDERLRFLKSLKTWDVFGKGWGRRVAEVKAAALAMAAGGAPATEVATPAQGRGAAPVAAGAPKVAAGAVAVGGAAAAQQAHQGGASVLTIIAIVLITAVLAIAGWVMWSRLQQRRQDRAA